MAAVVTCCIVALALVWQVIAAWRRLKTWLGFGGRARSAPYTFGIAAANALELLRHPASRVTVLALVAFEVGAASAYVLEHRVHLGNEIAAIVFDVTGYARGLCSGVAMVD